MVFLIAFHSINRWNWMFTAVQVTWVASHVTAIPSAQCLPSATRQQVNACVRRMSWGGGVTNVLKILLVWTN